MRPSKVSVAKAEAYYYDHDATYQQSDSEYLGSGAAALGIEGRSVKEEFSLLIRGFSSSGEKLAQNKNLPDDKAVAGTDIPLTLPKSWSVLALADPELRTAALESAKTVMQAVETNGWVEGRQTVDGKKERVTGKMIAAVFPHSASRENDSHFHIHGVFLNLTQRPDDSWSTVENHSLLQHSKEIRQMFLSEFAASQAAQKYGIELSVDRGGTVVPEAAGISESAKELFSKRNHEIHNGYALRERLREKLPNISSEALETLVQLSTRSAKNKDLTEADLIKSHNDQLKAAGLPTLDQLRSQSQSLRAEQSTSKLSGIEIVAQAAQDLSEHQSVFSRSELLQAALKQSIGIMTPAMAEKSITEAIRSSSVVGYGENKLTTPEIHQIEGRVATVAVEQREAFSPLLSDDQVQQTIDQFQEKKGFELTKGQAEAVGYVLQHTGRLGVIQGDAGAGKSSSMEAVADTIKAIGGELGVTVRGLTLQGKTSVLLQNDSGIESQTIDSFLNSKSNWDGSSRQLWVVDEYSMVDSRRLGALTVRAENGNAQIILLGDKKQLAAISAGKLGQDLDEKGLVKTVQMDESLRQKTEFAQSIDAAMKKGDIRAALNIMEAAGKLHIIENREERAAAMAAAFVEADQTAKEATNGKKGAIAMTLTNSEREAVIKEVRQIQKAEGLISKEDHTFTTRAPVALDAVTRKLAASYEPGQIAIPARTLEGIRAGSETRISAVDTQRNTLTLTDSDGNTATISAREHGNAMMVYQERETTFAVGERGVFLKSDNTSQGKHNKLKNGVGYTIQDISEGQLTIKTDFGNVVQISGDGAYITNAQTVTGHKAQGATEHTGVISVSGDDRLASQNMLYVLTTRQTHDLVAFTDDKEKLIESMSLEVKSSTLDEQTELLKTLTNQLQGQLQQQTQELAQVEIGLNKMESEIDSMAAEHKQSQQQQTRQLQAAEIDSGPDRAAEKTPEKNYEYSMELGA